MDIPVNLKCTIDKILHVLICLFILIGGPLRLFLIFSNRYLNKVGEAVKREGILPYHLSHYNPTGKQLMIFTNHLGVAVCIFAAIIILF